MKKQKHTSKAKEEQKYISVAQYASLCGKNGISKETIYKRINTKEILTKLISIGGYPTTVIDMIKYPPLPSKPRGRKKYLVTL